MDPNTETKTAQADDDLDGVELGTPQASCAADGTCEACQ